MPVSNSGAKELVFAKACPEKSPKLELSADKTRIVTRQIFTSVPLLNFSVSETSRVV